MESLDPAPKTPHSDLSPPNWKLQRRKVTVSYGYITFAVCVVFLIILPGWNRISNYIYYRFLQMNRMFKLNLEKRMVRMNPMSAQMIIFWSIVLSILTIASTNLDIRFLAARLGRVPVYCLPTVLFLTLRPSPLPDVLYLSLLPIHKWLSRLVVLQSLLHTIAYLYLAMVNDTFYKFKRLDNVNGIVAMIAFTIIVLTSLPKVRRKMYNLFFISHYICTWIATLTLYFHVRPGIPYLTMLNVCILIYQVIYKFRMSRLSVITTVKISDNMIIANLPNNSLANLNNMPGCHLRLIDFNENHSKFWNYLRFIFLPIQHPYTLATLGADSSQKLIIRVGKYKFKNNHQYLITGSYLPHLSFINKIKRPNTSIWNKLSLKRFYRGNENLLSSTTMMSSINNSVGSHTLCSNNNNNNNSLLVNTQVKKCLIVVGGSAISFALPILRVLNYNGAMVKIIWVIRDHEDLKALDYFKKYLINDDCIDIFITGSYTLAEQANFKEALSELHQRKRELEFQQETDILNGGYSYYNSGKHSDTESTDINTIISDNQENSEPFEIDFNNVKFTDNTETTPLNNKKSLEVHSYGTSLTEDHDHPLLKPKHRKSCIELRNHHNEPSSYNTETIDIELKGSEAYERGEREPLSHLDTTKLPAAGVQYQALDSNSRLNSQSNSTPLSIKKELAKNMHNVLSTLNTNESNPRSPKTKTGKYIPHSPNLNTPVSSTGIYDSTVITRVSSALYDDLEDYWVLKNSFSQIEFGRPKLGLQYYSWCIGSSCIGPLVSLQSGQSICYNMREDPSSPFNELYTNDTFIANQNARFAERNGAPDEKIWVIGAGPSGLVDNVRLWANDCGFSFHEESFIV